MDERSKRLAALQRAQQRLQAVQEARHAGHLAAAARAEAEAAELRTRADAADSLASVFPGLYSRRIAEALERGDAARRRADEEARRVATASLRSDRLDEIVRAARRDDERRADEKTAQELIEQRLARRE